jgi:hypothetical protein
MISIHQPLKLCWACNLDVDLSETETMQSYGLQLIWTAYGQLLYANRLSVAMLSRWHAEPQVGVFEMLYCFPQIRDTSLNQRFE